jgi:hypothetical protein
MKKTIILSVLLVIAVAIVILHREYKNNHMIEFLYGAVKGLSIFVSIALIVKRITAKPVVNS